MEGERTTQIPHLVYYMKYNKGGCLAIFVVQLQLDIVQLIAGNSPSSTSTPPRAYDTRSAILYRCRVVVCFQESVRWLFLSLSLSLSFSAHHFLPWGRKAWVDGWDEEVQWTSAWWYPQSLCNKSMSAFSLSRVLNTMNGSKMAKMQRERRARACRRPADRDFFTGIQWIRLTFSYVDVNINSKFQISQQH